MLPASMLPISIDCVESAHTIASILVIDEGADEAGADIDSMAFFCLLLSRHRALRTLTRERFFREASREEHFLGSFFVL